MMVEPDRFWGRNHYEHPALTEEMLARAEQRLGVKLPAEYVALLRTQNGGYTRGFGYPMSQETSWAEDHVPLHDLAGIVTDPDHSTAQNILDTPYLAEEWGLPPRQVLLSGDGHWWITLDYRGGDEPSVAWIDVECGEDIQVAPSFSSFLQGLRPDSEFREDEDD
jgi:hypothetical protein